MPADQFHTVKVTIYVILYVCTGNIDAFSVGLLGEGDSTVTITLGQIFKWDKIYLNVQNSYDTQTGE